MIHKSKSCTSGKEFNQQTIKYIYISDNSNNIRINDDIYSNKQNKLLAVYSVFEDLEFKLD